MDKIVKFKSGDVLYSTLNDKVVTLQRRWDRQSNQRTAWLVTSYPNGGEEYALSEDELQTLPYRELKSKIDRELDNYTENGVGTERVIKKSLLENNNIDSLINGFNVKIRGLIQENTTKLSNYDIEDILLHSGDLIDNFGRITKR